MNKNILIIIGILLLVGFGFLFVTNMTGNVITGSVVGEKVLSNDYFKIGEVGEVLNETADKVGDVLGDVGDKIIEEVK